jgi:hypothetical protein
MNEDEKVPNKEEEIASKDETTSGKEDTTKNYEVGYRTPPKHTRFQRRLWKSKRPSQGVSRV